MDEVARLGAGDRSDLFRAAAVAKGVTFGLIEKDFWVCWLLKHLFTLDHLSTALTFKGGTSLSKVYAVIDRMSEDIDIVIRKEDLGCSAQDDPGVEGISGKQRSRRINHLKALAVTFVRGPLASALLDRCETVLGAPGPWQLEVDVEDESNPRIFFRYPGEGAPSAYLRPSVMLELGCRGSMWPSAGGTVMPYAAEIFPTNFKAPQATVRVLTAERTFWEKATILHSIAHRGTPRLRSRRQSRHYYDVFCLWKSGLGRLAADDRLLLEDVVRHSSMFYCDPRSRYELALQGALRLVPDRDLMADIQADYEEMCEVMVFGQAPPLREVIGTLTEIERAVNGAHR